MPLQKRGIIFLKNSYAAIAQSVERILGKDEVGSSNLPSSSTKIPEIFMVFGIFLFAASEETVFKNAKVLSKVQRTPCFTAKSSGKNRHRKTVLS